MKKYLRFAGVSLLAALTVYGFLVFAGGDAATVASWWRANLSALALVICFAAADTMLDGICWVWIYRLFGAKVPFVEGCSVFMSGFAGAMLPVKMGNVIRPDAAARLGMGTFSECAKAEVFLVYMDFSGAMALLAGIAAYRINPILCPAAAVIVFFGVIALTKLTDSMVAKFHITLLPCSTDMSLRICAILFLQTTGWFVFGLALYWAARGLPGDIGILEAPAVAAVCALAGAASGLPGGIGVNEGMMSMSLRQTGIPAEHLIFVVGAFRLLTYWLKIPVGWIAFAFVNHRVRALNVSDESRS